MGFLLRLVANTLAILIVAWMLDGITVVNWVTGVLAGFVLALVNAIVKPILVILTLPLTLLTLGLFYFIVSIPVVVAAMPGERAAVFFRTGVAYAESGDLPAAERAFGDVRAVRDGGTGFAERNVSERIAAGEGPGAAVAPTRGRSSQPRLNGIDGPTYQDRLHAGPRLERPRHPGAHGQRRRGRRAPELFPRHGRRPPAARRAPLRPRHTSGSRPRALAASRGIAHFTFDFITGTQTVPLDEFAPDENVVLACKVAGLFLAQEGCAIAYDFQDT